MAETKTTEWVKMKPSDIEKKVIELAKQGISAEKIGLKLRDEHGIPKVKLFNLKIKKILEKENLWQNPETKNVEKKLERLKKHSVKHIHDYPAKRSLVKNVPKLSKLKNR
ncbi:hypothetical protein COU60_04545 [Candidatus Pacearchaeota archaeon CG10_big_fil_rev_8_21_14_0_10_34_76]|nr:MAG: hypothetical protein COU60_04545 [Candidatus Pacearchaeota archaeon CG10_big_fil_rev_8_21_14_0_10_34_76]